MTTPANIPLTPYERIMLELTAYAAGGGTLPKPLRAKVDGLLTDAQPEAPKAQGEAVNDSDCLACGHIINVHYKWGCGVAGCTCNAFIGGAAKASPPAPAPVNWENGPRCDCWHRQSTHPELTEGGCGACTVTGCCCKTFHEAPPAPAPVKGYVDPHVDRKCEHCGCNTNACLRRCCDKGHDDDARKGQSPAPVQGKEKCGLCGKVLGEHLGSRRYCRVIGEDKFTPAPQPTEQKAQTPAPDAELAAAKESLVQKTLKHVEHVRAVGFTRPLHVTAQAVLDAVDIVVALESRKAVKVEGEWPKVFVQTPHDCVRVMRSNIDGHIVSDEGGVSETLCTVDEILASKISTELPRAEVPAWLEKHGFNADGTRRAEKPASTHRYRLIEDGMTVFGDGSLEALQEWVNKIAAEDRAVQPC